MKKEIAIRKMQEGNGHKFLQLIFFFHLCFYVQRVKLQRKKKERKQGRSLLFLFILMGKVHIYWFKYITSRGGKEFRDLDW